MTPFTLAMYHRLPSPFRSVAATGRGHLLRRWRYGPETERMVGEALERETWSQARWALWREERLARILHRAATSVPYYREYWSDRRRRGDRRTVECLEHWPILEKAAVRANPRRLVADDCRIERMFHDSTSGTTGTPIDIWLSRRTVREWYALFEQRVRIWNGVSRTDRWAIVGGQLVVPIQRRRPPFWVWNGGLRQLYCSAYHLAPDLTPHYLDALRRYRVTYIVGYPSALYELALAARRAGRNDIRFKAAISNAEPMFDHQRQAIRDAFHCDVRDTYGMAEITAAGSECACGRLHEWPEAGWTEMLDGADRPVAPGVEGQLVSTGLLNADMPLVRYRVGDRLTRSADNRACGCCRTLPVITSVEGRLDDVLYTADGRTIGRLDPIFKTGIPVLEAQIVQEAIDRITVRFVPAPEFDQTAARSLEAAIHSRLGNVTVALEPVAQIPRGPNGKFRTVVSAMHPPKLAHVHEARERMAAHG